MPSNAQHTIFLTAPIEECVYETDRSSPTPHSDSIGQFALHWSLFDPRCRPRSMLAGPPGNAVVVHNVPRMDFLHFEQRHQIEPRVMSCLAQLPAGSTSLSWSPQSVSC